MSYPIVAENLVTSLTSPRLLGGRHIKSGKIVFPYPSGSEAAYYEQIELADSGTLWSFTMQHFRPKSPPYAGPDAFTPYLVGYIELANQVIVESRIVDTTISDLKIGMEMTLCITPFETQDGSLLSNYAFKPAEIA